MDENLSGADKLRLVVKEMKVGFCNGSLLGVMTFLVLGIYIALFKGYAMGTALLISGCVGVSLLVAIIISSLWVRWCLSSSIKSTSIRQWRPAR